MPCWSSPRARWTAFLLAAAAWRLLLFIGPQGSDDLYYSDLAYNLSRGLLQLAPDPFYLRFGYIGPIALSYSLFGPGSFSLVLLNIISSLAGVALTYAVAREFLDEKGSWTAAMLMAIFPLDVFFATEAHTDTPLSTLVILAIFLFLKGRRTGNPAALVGAGLALGMGCLVKESAFFGLAAIAVVGGRPHKRDAAVLAGFFGVILAEAVFYSLATGDPWYRIRAVREYQVEDIRNLYASQSISPETFWLLPLKMFFLPWYPHFPYFSLIPAAAAAGLLHALLPRRHPCFRVGLWLIVLMGLLVFWPIRFSPYLPALRTHPRIFLLLGPPLAILAAHFIRSLSPGMARGMIAILMATLLPCSIALQQDARQISAGARAAWERIPPDTTVVTDPRTAWFFHLYAGYSDAWKGLDWYAATPAGPHLHVINGEWIRRHKEWMNIDPPGDFLSPGGRKVFSETIPGRLRLRPLFSGRIERTPGSTIEIYEMPGRTP